MLSARSTFAVKMISFYSDTCLYCRNLHPRGTVDLSSEKDDVEPVIKQVPFAFDLLRLIPLCQQVELLFSTLIQGNKTSVLFFHLTCTEMGIPDELAMI